MASIRSGIGENMEDRYLFKGKNFKEWHIGNIVKEPDGLYIRDIKGNAMSYIDNESTICQCTGLKDKNGKLIWENDVVEAWSQGRCAIGKIKHRIDGTWIMYPAWQNGEMWYLLPNDDGITTVEVIGNIFDNPELLESEEK